MCARSAAGEVRCWGLDDDGALGRGISASLDCVHDGGEYGETNYDCERHPDCCVGDDEPPSASPLLELGGPAIQLSNGCALLEGGDVRCWGSNLSGQLGLGHTRTIGDNEVPASVDPISLGGPAIKIASSWVHACALLEGGDVRCWGSGSSGVLGYGNTDDIGDDELPSDVGPVSLGGPAFEVAVGYAVSCALRADGALYCWGSGHFGSLGHGSSVIIGDDELPSDASPIDLGRPVKQIAPGYTTCAILDDGLVRCWGRGFYGELGSGRTGPCRDTYSSTCCIGDVPGELPPSPVVLF